MKSYTQCLLLQPTDKGSIHQRVFIPTELVKPGGWVVLEGDDKPWEIAEIGSHATQEMIDSHRQAWKRWESVIK